jgi:hypothetical protein
VQFGKLYITKEALSAVGIENSAEDGRGFEIA